MKKNVAQDCTGSGTKVAQKRGRRTEADRTAELADSLPEGITIGRWGDGRAKPFFVRHGPRTARVLESFAVERDRNDAAEKLAQGREAEGSAILGFDAAEWREWKAFRTRCPAPLHELEALWRGQAKDRSLKVSDAAKRYMATRSPDDPAFRHIRLHVRRICDAIGATPLVDVTGDMIRLLMERLVNPENGKPMSDVTKGDHLKNWNSFFERCVLEGWILRNPCALVQRPKVVEEDRDVLSARQIFDLLKANRDQPVVGRLVFELFGGMRFSSVARMSADHVKRDVKGIRMPGAEHKSTKTKFRQGHPDVLWEWFDHVGDAMWTDVTLKNYEERKREAFVRARVDNPGNVLRNSFATYMLAATSNAPLVARLMQHSSLKMLEIYEGVATEQDAKLIMAMGPAAVALEWEAFVAQAK
jgi:site-specific recombinase XerD